MTGVGPTLAGGTGLEGALSGNGSGVLGVVGGHTSLTDAIAALSPTHSWNAAVASGSLTAITGGVDLTATGTASYQQVIGSGDLRGVGFSGSQRFDGGFTKNDDEPFSFFCCINATVNNANGINYVILHTGNTGVSSFNSGFFAALSNLAGNPACVPYAMTAKSGVIRAETLDSGLIMFGQSFTYGYTYTGTAAILYVNGEEIANTIYNGGVDQSAFFRLGQTRGNASGSASNFQGRIGYPAWWQNVSLSAQNFADLHVASGL